MQTNNIDPQLSFQNLLREKFLSMQLKNPSYSRRSFSRKLSLNSGALSQILQGKRKVSSKMVKRIMEQLCFSPEEITNMLSLFSKDKEKQIQLSKKKAQSMQLTMDQFETISDGIHYALLSLMETKDFREDFSWIAKRLNVSVSKVKAAFLRLERLGMLDRAEDGSFRATNISYHSPDELKSLAIRKYHSETFEEAKTSLESVDIKKRDFTSLTMAIDVRKLEEAKKLVRSFREQMAALLEDGEKGAVYRFNIQLYPLTKEE